MKTIEIVIVHGDAKMDRFMHASGVFEPFKALAMPERIHFQFDESCGRDPLWGPIAAVLKEELQKKGKRVVAVFFPGRHEGSWVDKSVKVISDGRKWGMLTPTLEALGYVVCEKSLAAAAGEP